MFDFVRPTGFQQRAKIGVFAADAQAIDLFAVMQIDESFDRIDRTVHRARAEQRRQRTGNPARHSPQRQQPAALLRRQQAVHPFEMALFGCEMTTRKFPQPRIARHGEDTAVNLDRAGFTGMIRT